jgi:hypothetical protein
MIRSAEYNLELLLFGVVLYNTTEENEFNCLYSTQLPLVLAAISSARIVAGAYNFHTENRCLRQAHVLNFWPCSAKKMRISPNFIKNRSRKSQEI